MSSIPEYTVVIAVDDAHIDQLELVLPTWVNNKPSLKSKRFLVINDDAGSPSTLRRVDLIMRYLTCTYVGWPQGAVYESDSSIGRFGDAQRYKMLSSFVHCPAQLVDTPYWLKLDLDAVATGVDDWIGPEWFEDDSAIIAHPWGYTKPPKQMAELDAWVELNYQILPDQLRLSPDLGLYPKTPESTSVAHKRIISWCGFFNTEFTKVCSQVAKDTCGFGKLPVPSQDGFMWYMARRMGYKIVRTDMKSRGWKHCSNTRDIKNTLEEIANEKQESPSLRIGPD